MNSKTIISFAIILLSALSPVVAAENADVLLEKVAKNVSSAPSISADYTLSMPGQGSTSGNLLLSGQRFAMTSADVAMWYDGTTLWSLVKADAEVNVSEPTADELLTVNPFIIINAFRKSYSAAMVSASGSIKKIRLTAKSKNADIRTALVSVNTATDLPTQVTLTMASGQALTIRITGAAIGKAQPISMFRFQSKKHPGVAVNDLR